VTKNYGSQNITTIERLRKDTNSRYQKNFSSMPLLNVDRYTSKLVLIQEDQMNLIKNVSN